MKRLSGMDAAFLYGDPRGSYAHHQSSYFRGATGRQQRSVLPAQARTR